MIQYFGHYWPDRATADVTRYIHHARDMEVALRYCPGRQVVVQAGGHCGLWALWLAKRFQTVYTFEPAADNYECLVANCRERANIVYFNAALGERASRLELNFNVRNTGGHKISQKPGETTVTTIDGLALVDACDLIVLDVEGMELPALKGAARTLARFHPVLMLEDRGHGERHGWGSPEAVTQWLAAHGYRERGRISYDVIYA